MGPTWDRQDPGGPHVGHMNIAILVAKLPLNFNGSLANKGEIALLNISSQGCCLIWTDMTLDNLAN